MTYQQNSKQFLSFYKCIGTGYERGWYTNCHARYRIFEGARNTKKSYDIGGLEPIAKILTDPRRNILIIRKTADSNRSSTYNTIVSLINQPDVNQPDLTLRNDFKVNSSSMQITYKPTGQTITFKGMLNPEKVTSTRPQVGYLTDVYVEEAYELDDYEAWRRVDGSIRGKLPEGLYLQVTFILNPWNKDHWIYEQFFKGRLEDNVALLESQGYMDYYDKDLIIGYGKGLYLHKSTYLINEFRDKDIYDQVMAEYKKTAYEIYKVEGLGCWGNTGERTYEEWNDRLIRPASELNNLPYAEYAIGIDTGLSNGQGKIKKGDDIKSATTMQLCAVTRDHKKLVCLGETFQTNGGKNVKQQKNVLELQQDIVQKIIDWCMLYAGSSCLMKGRINVYVDSADIGFRQGLEITARSMGLYSADFIASTKKAIVTRVMFQKLLMAFGDLLVSENCPNLIREIKASHKGDKGEIRADGNDHAINANEYAMTPILPSLIRWKSFKER